MRHFKSDLYNMNISWSGSSGKIALATLLKSMDLQFSKNKRKINYSVFSKDSKVTISTDQLLLLFYPALITLTANHSTVLGLAGHPVHNNYVGKNIIFVIMFCFVISNIWWRSNEIWSNPRSNMMLCFIIYKWKSVVNSKEQEILFYNEYIEYYLLKF